MRPTGNVWLPIAAVVLTAPTELFAQPGNVGAHQKISATDGGLPETLSNADLFGMSVGSLGDFDGDGVPDLLVGAIGTDDGGPARGAAHLLLLNADGTVKSHVKISDTEGGFTGVLDDLDHFGRAVAAIGDLDDDGVTDVAVGAKDDDDGGTNRGAVWILFLNPDGTVKTHAKISDTEGGFTGVLEDEDTFGFALAPLGDFDGDGVEDLAVGAVQDHDGGPDRGAVWLLFLNPDGTVKSHVLISDTSGGFTGVLDNHAEFGTAIAPLGDFDGDGIDDLAVGSLFDDDGGFSHGAVWILFLNADGTVKAHAKISDTQGGFTGVLDDDDRFGKVSAAGDLNGDGIMDLAVGAPRDDDGGVNRGALWILFLDHDGSVKSHHKISHMTGGFTGTLGDEDLFGVSTTVLPDLDADGVHEVVVGAAFADDGGNARGAVWVLFLEGVSGTPADLADMSIVKGDLVSGALGELETSDDEVVRTRSEPGFSAFEPHVMEMVIGLFSAVEGPLLADLLVEARLNTPGGLQRLRLRNWRTGQFDEVASNPIGTAEETVSRLDVDATDRVRAADGRIELSVRHVVVATFSPLGFESLVDSVAVALDGSR